MEKEVENKNHKGVNSTLKYVLDKFDNTKFTINFLLYFAFIFLIIITIISALRGWINQQTIIDIGIMLIGLIVGALLSRKNGN